MSDNFSFKHSLYADGYSGANSRFVPSQWETLLQSNGVSHWLVANQESVLYSTRISAATMLTDT